MKNKYLIASALAVLLAIVIVLIIWLKPDSATVASVAQTNTDDASSSLPSDSDIQSSIVLANNNRVDPTQQDEALAASLQDTQIDCSIQATPAGQLILDSNIRNCFEYFLTQMGEKSLSVIGKQIEQHFSKILPAAAAAQATDLWQRYLKYREAEGQLQSSGNGANNSNPDHLKKVMEQLNQLRQRYFNPLEMTALFGDETTYNQYTLDRLDILDNKSLNAAQKAQQLKQRFAQLPPDLQKNLQDMSKLQDLRALTQQIKKNNGSKAELQQMRTQLVGSEAAQRLDQLDQSRADWQSRVDNYLGQRQAILNSNQAAQDKQTAISALRERQFSSDAERQRAITFEHFKDQGTDTSALQ